jgi:hypothetical protein
VTSPVKVALAACSSRHISDGGGAKALPHPQKERMKYPSSFKNYVNDVLKYCRITTFHGEYYMNVTFAGDDCEGYDGESRGVGASVDVDATYLNYTVTIYPLLYECYEAQDYKNLARYLLHETCHVFITPVSKWAKIDAAPSQLENLQDDVERQTQRITNTVFSLLPKNWWKPENLKKALA